MHVEEGREICKLLVEENLGLDIVMQTLLTYHLSQGRKYKSNSYVLYSGTVDCIKLISSQSEKSISKPLYYLIQIEIQKREYKEYEMFKHPL